MSQVAPNVRDGAAQRMHQRSPGIKPPAKIPWWKRTAVIAAFVGSLPVAGAAITVPILSSPPPGACTNLETTIQTDLGRSPKLFGFDYGHPDPTFQDVCHFPETDFLNNFKS